MARAFIEEQGEFWPMHYELLAIIAEQQSALLTAFLKAYGAKNVSDPIHIPRPHHTDLMPVTEEAEAKPADNVISFSEFAAMLRGRDK